MTVAASAPIRLIRRRPAAPPVSLLRVQVDEAGRTHADGIWAGPLNATPEDDPGAGPSPVEALLAGVAACVVRNLRWVADGAHVAFRRLELDLAAARDDDPPAIRTVRVELTIEADAPTDRVVGVVRRALRSGTITRTVARATEFSVLLRVNGAVQPLELLDLRHR
ncbi:MAG TPA: OsmC family protein [Candidatus Angelobacter sp.]|nr:OsmC family protein [Candidatus Angelobacter sp.]